MGSPVQGVLMIVAKVLCLAETIFHGLLHILISTSYDLS